MPFKDSDFKKLNKAEELRQTLNKKIAVINKFNDPDLRASERIAVADLVSGKTLQPKVNIGRQLTQQQETTRNFAPVLKEIDSLKDEIHGQTRVMENQHQLLALTHGEKAIEGSRGINLYERFGFTGNDLQYYREKGFEDLNTLARSNDQGLVQETLREITKQIKKLGNQKAAITRKKETAPI